MRVMVCRTGGTVLDEQHAPNGSCVGDTTGGVMGLIRYLHAAGHQVCFFGQLRGDVPYAKVVRPRVNELNGMSLVKDVTAAYDEAVCELADFAPDVCLNVGGEQTTSSWIDNPYGAGVLQAAVKYTAPALYAMQQLKLPRILILHDPRFYPRNHEMLYWEHCRPVVVLSLDEDQSWTFRMRDEQWQVNVTYSRGGNWWSYGLPYEPLTRTVSPLLPQRCTMVAHSHMEDGRLKPPVRDAAWRNLLEAYEDAFTIAGRGWDNFSMYSPEWAAQHWLGEVSPGECKELLKGSRCGPIIPIADRFTTSKMRQYVVNGCLPFPYGRGEPLTFDHRGEWVPLDAEVRVTNGVELTELVRRANSDEAWRAGWVERIREATVPDFSVLENAMRNWRTMKGYERV